MARRGELYDTPADAPTYEVSAEFWAKARPYARAKKAISLRVDEDVLDWFKAQGSGHLTRMNWVLRTYYDAQTGDASVYEPKAVRRRSAAPKRVVRRTSKPSAKGVTGGVRR
jgi:hypothetical protein